MLFLLCALGSAPSASAFSLPVQLSASEIEFGDVRLTGVAARLEAGRVHLNAAELHLASAEQDAEDPAGAQAIRYGNIQLECPQLQLPDGSYCPSGRWQLSVSASDESWTETVVGTNVRISLVDELWQVESSLETGTFKAQLNYPVDSGQVGFLLSWKAQDLQQLPFTALLPEELQWVRTGKSSADIKVILSPGNSISLQFDMGLEDLSFDSPEGRFAAEGLELSINGSTTLGEPMIVDMNTRFSAGEVLLDQFYTSFAQNPMNLASRLSLAAEEVHVQKLQIADSDALNVQATARFSKQDPLNTLQYRVSQLDMKFPMAYQRYLSPVLAAVTLDQLTMTGELHWSGTGEGDGFPNGTLVLEDLSVVDNVQNRFAFTGMNARILAGNEAGESQFAWRGMLLGRINLGAGQIGLATAPGVFKLSGPLALDVLGGQVIIDEFGVRLPADGAKANAGASKADPDVRFVAQLDELDMKQLTAALDWPAFEGTVSGRIPGVSYDDGVLTVDGEINLDAFDGQILLSDLRVERLFGVLPSLAANLELSNLDLQQVTGAFSFGSIAGRMDGYVRNLRMLDWSPVSFDAWFGTPDSQSDSREISRQAVNHLTSIGGGGATAALTGPLMRMFSNFSYRRLGMGCQLENYVCHMRGLEDEDNSVLIMEGSGIPKLMIRVFNRRMDFPQLVSNLAAATSGESIRVGDP